MAVMENTASMSNMGNMSNMSNTASMGNMANAGSMSSPANMGNMANAESMDDMEGAACALNTPPFPAVTVPAMAYVPFQQFGTIYPPDKGIERGTIFPELDKPFLGGRGGSK